MEGDRFEIDYAGLKARIQDAKAVNPPDWLVEGAQVTYQGSVGAIEAVLGAQAFIELGEGRTACINWVVAIAHGDLLQGSQEVTTKVALYDKIPQNFRKVLHRSQKWIQHIELTSAAQPMSLPLPHDLGSEMKAALTGAGFKELYLHQVKSRQSLQAGKDVVLCTPTASGKTGCYMPTVVDEIVKDPLKTALFLFPLRALALDQKEKLDELCAHLGQKAPSVCMLSSDVSKEERMRIFRKDRPGIVCMTPDLLHHMLYRAKDSGEWYGWGVFLSRLKFVVIDEAHTYIGSFGAHFQNLMVRLRIAVSRLRGDPDAIRFVIATATVANPDELCKSFTGRDGSSKVIAASTAGSPGKAFISMKPMPDPSGVATTMTVDAVKAGITSIIFVQSRIEAKRLMQRIANAISASGYSSSSVAVYYGSLPNAQRLSILQKVRNGDVKVVVSTSALEAGIDLPDMSLCIVNGYPGSLMSFRQRIGRAGRKTPGLVVFLPHDDRVLDLYFGKHPSLLLNGQVERVGFNGQYPTVLYWQILCACVESGVEISMVKTLFGDAAGPVVETLVDNGKLTVGYGKRLTGRGYPHRFLSIRGGNMNSVTLIDDATGAEIEQMSWDIAIKEVFNGALYMAYIGGQLVRYEGAYLEQSKEIARMRRLNSGDREGWSTKATCRLFVNMIGDPLQAQTFGANEGLVVMDLAVGWGAITEIVDGYKVKHSLTGNTCENPRCDLFKMQMKSSRCRSCNLPTKKADRGEKVEENHLLEPALTNEYKAPVMALELWTHGMEAMFASMIEEGRQKIAEKYGEKSQDYMDYHASTDGGPGYVALHSMGHMLSQALSMVVLGSHQDLNVRMDPAKPAGEDEPWKIWVYDTTPGGNGATENLFLHMTEVMKQALALSNACDCEYGCPACMHRHGCPDMNLGLEKTIGRTLIQAVLDCK